MQHIQTPAAPTQSVSRKPETASSAARPASNERNFSSDLNAATEGRGQREKASGNRAEPLALQKKLGELEVKLDEGESVSDETWLDLISEIKSMASDAEGSDEAELEGLRAKLEQLLGEAESDIAALVEALGLDKLAGFPNAIENALEGSSEEQSLDQLMDAIKQLDEDEFAQLQASLAQLLKTDGQLDAEQLEQQLAALLDSLQDAIDGDSKHSEESEQALALLQELNALLSDSDLDSTETQSAVQKLLQDLAQLDLSQLGPATQQRLADFMQTVDLQLRQAYQETTSSLASGRAGLGGNNLPPVAMALSEATQELRAQLQNIAQANAQTSAQSEDDDLAADALRRSLAESSTPQGATEQRGQWSTNSNLSTTNGQAMNPATAASQGRENQLQQMERQPSAFEAARQAQQAVDILGSGAANNLRERISVMFNTRTQAAEMRLDPPDLGRLTIRLNMNQEQAAVSFQVTTPQAREALEQSLPRLRELLQEQGIELADADISEQKSEQQASGQGASGQGNTGQGQRLAGTTDGFIADDAQLSQVEVDAPVGAADGRVDYFV